MRSIFAAIATIVISVQILIFSTASPAMAISADVAKRCREMAIKAHPPEPAGTKGYAQVERDSFAIAFPRATMQRTTVPKSPHRPARYRHCACSFNQALGPMHSFRSSLGRDSNSELGASARPRTGLDALLPSLDVSCIPPMHLRHPWPG